MGEGKLDTCDDLCHNAKSRREANISEWRGKGRGCRQEDEMMQCNTRQDRTGRVDARFIAVHHPNSLIESFVVTSG